jgi:hypothetical protein
VNTNFLERHLEISISIGTVATPESTDEEHKISKCLEPEDPIYQSAVECGAELLEKILPRWAKSQQELQVNIQFTYFELTDTEDGMPSINLSVAGLDFLKDNIRPGVFTLGNKVLGWFKKAVADYETTTEDTNPNAKETNGGGHE